MFDSKMRHWGVVLFLLLFAASTPAAGPALTTVQDTLYKADGTPFTGLLYINWKSFTTGDAQNVATHNVVATVVNGVLRVQLAPTTNASPTAWYQVQYNSNGYVQFTEYWDVPSSAVPVGLNTVRMATPPGAVGTTTPPSATTIQVTDVVGLSDQLAATVVRGPGFQPNRAAVLSAAGMLEGAVGNTYDCLHVDGTSGPCGSQTSTTSGPTFIDGEAPAGTVNGSNAVFTLTYSPAPAGSLALYRNGMLQKPATDYSLAGNIITFVAASIPASGDLLLASYRIGGASSLNDPLSGALIGSLPNPSLAAGVVTDYNIAQGAGIAESKLSLNYPTHTSAYDPTPEQKQAMGGTMGIVSGTNRYVTDQDPRLSDARSPKSHSMLSAAHSDSVAGTAVRGDVIVAQGQGVWTRLPLGSPNRCLMSNGSDAVWNTCLFTGFSAGSVPFVDPTGSLAQNASRLFWDNTSRRFGIGTNTPASTLHVQDSNPVTGSTTLTVRAGQGQGQNPLEHWLDANNVELGRLDSQGVISAAGFQTTGTAARPGWHDSGYASDPATLSDGDAWYNTASQSRRTREAGQSHTQPQVLCGSVGSSTGNTAATSLGSCTIPAGLLQPGDRLEVKFDYLHTGNSRGFTAQIAVNQATALTKSFSADQTAVGGSLSGGIYSGGMQWSAQTLDSSAAPASQVGIVSLNLTGSIQLDFRGSLSQSGADSVALQNFTVIRYPAQANP